jgi:serine/threonine protein kinase
LSENLVHGFLCGSLDDAAAREVKRHIDQCAECRELVDCLRRDQPADAQAATEPLPRATEAEEVHAILSALENPREDLSGQLLADKYRLERRLGAGGMGVVYEALNTWADRRVAVKLLRRSFSADSETISRFVREAKSANRVRHPSIVDVLDLGQDPSDGSLYMVQELLAGDTLRQRLTAKTRLSVAEMAAIMIPVMDALACAHEAGVVHRDVKPENIILSVDRVGKELPKLIDFGISKIVEGNVAALVQTGRAVGTPLYMSPEQLRADETIDGRTDVWAVGVVIFELLAGRRPFDAPSHNEVVVKIFTTDAPPIDSVAPEVPEDIAQVITRALARDREARFPTMRAMHDAFLGCPTARGEPPRDRKTEPAQKTSQALAGALTVLARPRVLTRVGIFAIALALAILIPIYFVHSRRTSVARTELWRKLIRMVPQIRTLLRSAHMLPAHDIRPERARVRDLITEVERQLDTPAGHDATALGDYVLGEGYLALGAVLN